MQNEVDVFMFIYPLNWARQWRYLDKVVYFSNWHRNWLETYFWPLFAKNL